MSAERLEAFLAKVKGDSNLQEKLKAVKSPKEVVGVAKEQDNQFTADKVTEVSKDELKGMACGTASEKQRPNTGWYSSGRRCGTD